MRNGRSRCSVRWLKARMRSTMSLARSPAFFTSCTCCHSRLSRRTPGQQHLGIAENGAEDVVEVMRDASGQRADRLHALGMPQACFERLPFALARSRNSAFTRISPIVRSSAMSSSVQRFLLMTASKPRRPTLFPACHSGTQSQERIPHSISLVFASLGGSAATDGDVDAAITLIFLGIPYHFAVALRWAFASGRQPAVRPAVGHIDSAAKPAVACGLRAMIGSMEDDIGTIHAHMLAQPFQRLADRFGRPLDGRVDQLPGYAGDHVLEIRSCPQRAGIGAQPHHREGRDRPAAGPTRRRAAHERSRHANSASRCCAMK